nr:hypothetical protein [Tanacetum cinerariifolium]
EVVARSATWLGRVLSCVCAHSIEDDSRPSFDLNPAQTNTRHFQSVCKYLLMDVALVPEKLKRIPLQVKLMSPHLKSANYIKSNRRLRWLLLWQKSDNVDEMDKSVWSVNVAIIVLMDYLVLINF